MYPNMQPSFGQPSFGQPAYVQPNLAQPNFAQQPAFGIQPASGQAPAGWSPQQSQPRQMPVMASMASGAVQPGAQPKPKVRLQAPDAPPARLILPSPEELGLVANRSQGQAEAT